MSISPTELTQLNPELNAHAEANYTFRSCIYSLCAHFTKEDQNLVLGRAAEDAVLDVSNDPTIQVTKKVTAYILQNNLGFQHTFTDVELKQFYQAALDYIRPFYPELFSQISLDSSETEIASFLNSLVLSIARKCFSGFSEIIEQKRDSLPDPMINFLDSIKPLIDSPDSLNFPDYISQINPHIQPFQQLVLTQFNQETNHTATSLEEMHDIQLHQNIEDFLSPYLANPDSFNSQDFLASLCRQSFSHLFYKGILNDVKTNTQSSRSLKIFDLLIQDYISSSNSHLWRHSAGLNYGYALKSIDDAVDQNPPETSEKMLHRFQAASKALNSFESLLDNFVEHFDQVRNMRHYLPALLFLDPKPVLESIKQTSSDIKLDPHILSMQAGFLKAVIEEAAPQLGPFEKDLTLFRIRLQFLSHLGTLPDITPNLTPQQQKVVEDATRVFDASLEACHQKLSELKQMRRPDYQTNNCSLLGIGFTGRDFEEEGNADNILFLNFSLTMSSRHGEISGSPLLYATQCFFLLDPTSQTPTFTVEVIENAEQDDLRIFNYIVHHIIKTITSQQSPAIHQDILESFASTFKELLKRQKTTLSRELQLLEKKLTDCLVSYQQMEDHHRILRMMIPDCDMLPGKQKNKTIYTFTHSAEKLVEFDAEKERLTKQQKEKRLELTHCKEMLGKLQKNDYTLDSDYLIKLIDEKKDRICVEPVISRVTGNPYTLSFAMSEHIREHIFLNQGKFPLGANRPLIQPCNLKCQLFSPAHMLWAELTHFPTAQQAHQRSEKKGGPGLASIFS